MSRGTVHELPGLERSAALLRCLGHPLRLRLLQALRSGERTVSDLQADTGEGQATVSRQLAVLRARQVVSCRRDGVNVHYRISEPGVHEILACLENGRSGVR